MSRLRPTQTEPMKAALKVDHSSAREVEPTDRKAKNQLARFGGSKRHSFNCVVLREVLLTVCVPGECDQNEAVTAAMAALAAFKPANEIEGMLAAQAVAMHFGAMECFRRTILPGQPAEVAAKLRRDGVNLARGMTDMLDALNRQRGKGPQVVRVERVVVHEGGQAIVGSVQAGPVSADGKGVEHD